MIFDVSILKFLFRENNIPTSHIHIISNVHEVGTCIRNLRLDHHGARVSVCILIEGI